MRTRSNNDYIYIGKEAGKEILSRIKSAKQSVKVVSPYLSPDYIKELIKLHKECRQVTLITCDKIGENAYSDFKASDLINKREIYNPSAEKTRKRGLGLTAIVFMVMLMLALWSVVFPALWWLSGLLFILSLIMFFAYYFVSPCKIEYYPIFRIKVFDSTSGEKRWSTELIHSKIFVIDDETAFLGSVNFTYSGFKTHYETAIRVEDKSAVAAISEEVERLYDSKDLRAKSVEEWAGA
jgi:phosphatidylserine/phosphatidylglycerophosphate/cardiolipin synthase-like enzyme